MATPSDLLTVSEAAQFLHLQPSTVRAWIQKRRIAHVKLGSRVFLRRQDLAEFVTSHVIPPTKEKAQAIV